MSTQQVRSIEEYFPTEPWLEEYRKELEASEKLDQTGEGWGTDFNGEMIFHIKNIPLAEKTVGDLPAELVEAIDEVVDEKSEEEIEQILETAPQEVRDDVEARDGDLRERVRAELHETTQLEAPERIWPDLRGELPETLDELLVQIEDNVVDGDTVYSWLDLYDGGCREVEVLTDLDQKDYGFRIEGDYEVWKALTEGEGGVINKLMAGDLDVDGDMQIILQYSEAAVDLAEISADVDSRYVV